LISRLSLRLLELLAIAVRIENSRAVASLMRSSNAGLALMAVSPATTAANELPKHGKWYEIQPKQPPLYAEEPPLYAEEPPLYGNPRKFQGIPGNSQKRAVFEPGIPMGIPTIPDLGNSRFGNST